MENIIRLRVKKMSTHQLEIMGIKLTIVLNLYFCCCCCCTCCTFLVPQSDVNWVEDSLCQTIITKLELKANNILQFQIDNEY